MGNPMVKSDFGYTCGKCLQIQWQIVYKMVDMDGAARCKWWARVLSAHTCTKLDVLILRFK